MAEYERSRLVQASPDDVFAFVSDASNLATILADGGRGRAASGGSGRGPRRGPGQEPTRTTAGSGSMRPGAALTWGADERTYSGWLTVAADDGGAQVVAHLSFAPYVTPTGRPISGEPAADPDPIEQSLEAALDSLRNLMEGRGGKEEPASVG